MDDFISLIFGLLFLAAVAYVVIVVTMFIITVIAFTAVVLLPLAIIATYAVLRLQSVDERQAFHRLKAINPWYFASVLLPGLLFWINIQEPGCQEFLTGLNAVVWVSFLCYLAWLGVRASRHELAYQRSPKLKDSVLKADGSINVNRIARAAPAMSTTAPPEWKSRHNSRQFRGATARINP